MKEGELTPHNFNIPEHQHDYNVPGAQKNHHQHGHPHGGHGNDERMHDEEDDEVEFPINQQSLSEPKETQQQQIELPLNVVREYQRKSRSRSVPRHSSKKRREHRFPAQQQQQVHKHESMPEHIPTPTNTRTT
eukprot:UN27719